jgi:hypothetical protein
MAVALVLATLVVTPPAAAGVSAYSPPVDAPIRDPFRPPPSPYAPGNRGLEYATAPGSQVRAASDGTVVFAGNVGGALHVTVRHPDGLRTSYSFLQHVAVRSGDRVARGDVLGTTLDRLHFGVRDAVGHYLDPASLFTGAQHRGARLVPGSDEGEEPLVERERRHLLELVVQQAARGLLTESHARAARLAFHYAVEQRPEVRAARLAARYRRLRRGVGECTSPGEAAPVLRDRHVAVLVGGLGSSATDAAVDDVDTTTLGFAPGDVVRFSYAGGRIPDDGDADAFAPIDARGYDGIDTTVDLARSAERLAALLVAVAATLPGVPIDVIAHSQGGVVARRAVARLAAEGRLPTEVASVAMLATPQRGADLATAADAWRTAGGVTGALLDRTGVDLDAPSVRQLSEASPFATDIADARLPDHLRTVSIAARGDLVVSLPNTMTDDVPTAVVGLGGPSAHRRLPGSADTTRELALAVAGRSPTCVSDADAAAALLVGEAISWATDAAGAARLAVGPAPS